MVLLSLFLLLGEVEAVVVYSLLAVKILQISPHEAVLGVLDGRLGGAFLCGAGGGEGLLGGGGGIDRAG